MSILQKIQMAGSIPRVSDSMILGGGLRICISGKFPGDSDSAGPRTTLSEPPLNQNPSISDEETGVQV